MTSTLSTFGKLVIRDALLSGDITMHDVPFITIAWLHDFRHAEVYVAHRTIDGAKDGDVYQPNAAAICLAHIGEVLKNSEYHNLGRFSESADYSRLAHAFVYKQCVDGLIHIVNNPLFLEPIDGTAMRLSTHVMHAAFKNADHSFIASIVAAHPDLYNEAIDICLTFLSGANSEKYVATFYCLLGERELSVMNAIKMITQLRNKEILGRLCSVAIQAASDQNSLRTAILTRLIFTGATRAFITVISADAEYYTEIMSRFDYRRLNDTRTMTVPRIDLATTLPVLPKTALKTMALINAKYHSKGHAITLAIEDYKKKHYPTPLQRALECF